MLLPYVSIKISTIFAQSSWYILERGKVYGQGGEARGVRKRKYTQPFGVSTGAHQLLGVHAGKWEQLQLEQTEKSLFSTLCGKENSFMHVLSKQREEEQEAIFLCSLNCLHVEKSQNS